MLAERGLGQGDPLSPYLFILCAEGLSAMLKKREVEGKIHGCKIARNAPVVLHLFSPDDSFLFFRANHVKVSHLKSVLQHYKQASG